VIVMTHKILAVDDEPSIVKLIATTLRARGHEVLEATNGQMALEKAEKDSPDLILLDIMMPRMDGREVRRRLRSKRSTADIPVVYLSAVGDFESQLKGMEEDDLTDYITKPFTPGDLAERVESLLDPSESGRVARETRAKTGSLRTIVEIMHRDRER
jgi:DNA-binding response OmpR family regulator